MSSTPLFFRFELLNFQKIDNIMLGLLWVITSIMIYPTVFRAISIHFTFKIKQNIHQYNK